MRPFFIGYIGNYLLQSFLKIKRSRNPSLWTIQMYHVSILNAQYHTWWWPGNTRSQGISTSASMVLILFFQNILVLEPARLKCVHAFVLLCVIFVICSVLCAFYILQNYLTLQGNLEWYGNRHIPKPHKTLTNMNSTYYHWDVLYMVYMHIVMYVVYMVYIYIDVCCYDEQTLQYIPYIYVIYCSVCSS